MNIVGLRTFKIKRMEIRTIQTTWAWMDHRSTINELCLILHNPMALNLLLTWAIKDELAVIPSVPIEGSLCIISGLLTFCLIVLLHCILDSTL